MINFYSESFSLIKYRILLNYLFLSAEYHGPEIGHPEVLHGFPQSLLREITPDMTR
jgi:hypothetical protein